MNKTAIVFIDTHGGYENVNDWLFAKNTKKHDNNYVKSSVISNLNIIKINKISPGVCSFGTSNEVGDFFRNIRLHKGSPIDKKKTIGEMAIYLQRKLKGQDEEYGLVKKCKKDQKDIIDIINEEIKKYENWDEDEGKHYNKNLKTCNRKRHRINRISSGEHNDKILNKIYQYEISQRDDQRKKNNYYKWSVTALIRSNNSTKFEEIKDFTKEIEHKYDNGFVEFSLEELFKYLKKLKVKNILIVDLTCNTIEAELLESFGITDEFITEQKAKKNNTVKSCKCKEFSFFGGGNKRTRKKR